MQDFESVKKVISEMLLELNDNLAGIDDMINLKPTGQPQLMNANPKESDSRFGDFQE